MGLAALIASCSDDDRNNDTDNQHLVSPSMAVSISNTDGRQSPFTGILTIMPCDANSSIYYGNYVKGKLSPFYGYYRVKDGSFHDNSINREISLPIGTYNMIYWGTPQYQTPIYAHPAIKEAAHSIGADMSKQSLGLFRISADTIYYPVFDLVYAIQPVNIGSESLSGSLKRPEGQRQCRTKFQYRQCGRTHHQHLQRTQLLYGKTARYTTYNRVPSDSFERWYSDEQQHRYAVPVRRKTGIPTGNHS